MFAYTVTVATGTTEYSGTNNHIYITLEGESRASPRLKLDRPFCNDLERGSIGEYTVESKKDLGKVLIVRLDKEKFLGVEDDWFCMYVTVSPPTGDTLHFPCYRWLSEEISIYIRAGPGVRLCDDRLPVLLQHRKKELQERQALYRWKLWKRSAPKCIEADTEDNLHQDVKFDQAKQDNFESSLHLALGELLLKKLVVKMGDSWGNLEDFERIFWRIKSPIGGFVREYWREDWFFAYQFLNGCNPCLIQRCREIPKKFPVTEEMVCKSLPGSTLDRELKKGNIFLVDYQLLEGVPANVIQGKQQFLAAPICLLYQPPNSPLLPIAIQLGQTPGPQSPIFLPSDPELDWLLAKLWVRSSDFQIHQISQHLCGTHLVGEVFCIATLRQLPAVHPIYKLLTPNIRFTLEINVRARNQLISESGIMSRVVASGGPGLVLFVQKSFKALSYSSLCLPEAVRQRDVGSLRDYYYRDDGLLIWEAILKYVQGVIELYYLTDEDVLHDSELQSWLTDMVEEGFQELPDIGFPRVFRTRPELCKFLTMVIFTCSAQHSAINNGQFDWYCWVPNAPCTMRQPPPCTKGSVTMEKIMASLPDISQSSVQMAFTRHLSSPRPDKRLLGFFDEEYFTEKASVGVIQEFREELERINQVIEKRNAILSLTYHYMVPNNIDSSICL